MHISASYPTAGGISSGNVEAANLNRFLPVPKNGVFCPVSGFGHARFYQQVVNGPGRKHVRILDLKQPGQTRGTKFYHAGDLMRWLESLCERVGEVGS